MWFHACPRHAADNQMVKGADDIEVYRPSPIVVMNDGQHMKAF